MGMRFRRSWGWLTCASVLLLGMGSAVGLRALGQEKEKASSTDADAAQRLKEMKAAAAGHAIERESNPPVRLELVPEPVLRWTNPLRIAYDGAVFVWVADGRPEVVGSFYRNTERGSHWEHHEFESLSESNLTATYRGETAWAPRSEGISLKPIPNAPAPADSADGRLRQMRALAREFQAGYGQEERSRGLSLRLLTKPLYRYTTSAPTQPDGAVFAFVEATDPEVLLVIETRSVNGASAWHYSFAPLSGRGLRGWHKDVSVWQVPVLNTGPDAPYVNLAERLPIR